MGEPVYFFVERHPRGEQPAICYGQMPRRGVVYGVRVDTLPNAATWLKMSLAELYAAYLKARDGKTLPVDPKLDAAASAPAQRAFGERRTPSPRPWAHLPAEPFPTVEDLDQRAARRVAD